MAASLVPAASALDDCLEADEICVRFRGGLWLWLVVSRQVKQVLGFVFGQRDITALAEAWTDVPSDWARRAVCTDHLRAYGSFFPTSQHTACDKGTGLTSIVEALNTKWRQRHSGLVRRSCGVCWRIVDDLFERLLILVDQHNREQAKRWERINGATQSSL